ncbi:MAG: hypothetical protein ABEH38_09685 [Flavobacteriales bacterium]
MQNLPKRIHQETGYPPQRLEQMLREDHGREVARRLVSGDEPTYGYQNLWWLGRLDLTAEHIMLKDEYKELFEESILDQARRRLKRYGGEV